MYSVTVTSETADSRAREALPEEAHESIRWALQYWDRCRGKRRMPARRDVDPLDFPRLLPTTYLLERLSEQDFLVRVAGTRFREVYGREVTGERISAFIPNDSGRDFYSDVEICSQDLHPVFRDGRATWRPSGIATRFQRVMLPLGNTESSADHLLGFAVFFDEDGRAEL